MGIFGSPERRSATISDELFAQRRGGSASVSPDKALQLAAVWACYRILAGVGSTLPIDQFRGSEPVSTEALFAEPVAGQPVSDWLHRLWISVLSTGNAYAYVSHDSSAQRVVSAELLPSSLIRWEQRNKQWVALINGKPEKLWPNGSLWHLPLFTVPGHPEGLSPIGHAAATINAGLSAQEFGNRWYADGGHPSAIISTDQDINADQARGIKAAFQAATMGSREPAVMGSGLKYEAIQTNPNESQFLDSMQWSASQIAASIGVPPEWIGSAVSGSSVTYANKEQNWADWTARDFIPYLVRFEAGLSRLLPTGEHIKFNINALLRSDLAARYASYKIAAEIGDITGTPLLLNSEMRGFENLQPIAGGDTFDRRTSPLPSPPGGPSAA